MDEGHNALLGMALDRGQGDGQMRAKRTDDNHKEIVKAARSLGCSVADTSAVGNGFPDLVIGVYAGRRINLMVEVKDGKKSASRRKLTEDQVEFHKGWRGQIAIVETVQDLVNLIGGCK